MINQIENIVCLGEGIDPASIHCRSRKGGLKETRQIIMYFAKRLYPAKTWAEIADYFALDHASAMHASKTIQNLIDTNREFREKMNKHNQRLKVVRIDRIVSEAVINIKPLEFEILRLEDKISELKDQIKLIKFEISEI
jgi:hypothetical protein